MNKKSQKNIKIIKKAFSMLELLITLVAVSCLLAAFVPVITKLYSPMAKKVQAQTEEGVDPGEYIIPKSQADCPNYSKYVDGRTDGEEGGYCVTKWNMGDDDESNMSVFALTNGQKLIHNDTEYALHYALADGQDAAGCVASNSPVEPFATDSMCCWGRSNTQTSNEYTAIDDSSLENPSTYSGRARTVCTWQAAVALCENWAPKGFKKGDWRVPDVDQMKNWRTNPSNNSSLISGLNSGSSGLQLCGYYPGYRAVQCLHPTSTCIGAANSGRCYPLDVWTSRRYSSSSSYVYYFKLLSGNFVDSNTYASSASSVRCLAEKVPSNINHEAFKEKRKIFIRLETEEGDAIEKYKKEYLIKDTIKSIVIKNIYSAGGDGGGSYFTQNSEVITPASQDDCPNYSKYVNGTCVAKWNLGDNVESGLEDFRLGSTALPTNVKLNTSTLEYDPSGTELTVYAETTGTSGSCNASSQSASTTDFTTGNKLCCWNSGVTSDPDGYETSSGTSTYSGGERTLCTWHAAVALCENWAPEGTSRGNWHLPTTSQLSVWSSNLASLNTNQGADGLQLCDYSSGYGAARCYSHPSACVGAYGSRCSPYLVWSRSVYSSSDAYYRCLNSGSFNQYRNYPSNAFSVRCLAEKVNKNATMYACGAGGNTGYHSSDIEIPKDIINSAIGGKVVIDRMYESGQYSAVLVYNSSNELIWGYRAPKGYSGGNGLGTMPSITIDAQATDTACGIYEDGNWIATACTTSKTWEEMTALGTGDFHVEAGNVSSAAGASFNTEYTGGGSTRVGETPEDGVGYASGGGGACPALDGSEVAGGKGGIGYIELEIAIEE